MRSSEPKFQLDCADNALETAIQAAMRKLLPRIEKAIPEIKNAHTLGRVAFAIQLLGETFANDDCEFSEGEMHLSSEPKIDRILGILPTDAESEDEPEVEPTSEVAPERKLYALECASARLDGGWNPNGVLFTAEQAAVVQSLASALNASDLELVDVDLSYQYLLSGV